MGPDLDLTDWHSDAIPERCFRQKDDFEKNANLQTAR